MISDDRIADLSALNVLTYRNIHGRGGHRVIQGVLLDNPATAAPLRELLDVPLRQGSRLGAHQVSSYSDPTL